MTDEIQIKQDRLLILIGRQTVEIEMLRIQIQEMGLELKGKLREQKENGEVKQVIEELA